MGTPPPNTVPCASTQTAQLLQLAHKLRQSPVVTHCEKALLGAGIRPGARLVLGCSGGPDSTALMVALWLLSPRHHWHVQVVSVDHGLRKEAAREAQQVVAVATQLGLSAQSVRVAVPRTASIQSAARTARYEALESVARKTHAQAVLTAHTLDDQAETVLLRLTGGAGLRGLGGIPKARPLSQSLPGCLLLRPLLAVEKTQVLALIDQAASVLAPLPLHDPSNDNRSFRRVAVRHELLPALSAIAPAQKTHLAQLADQLRADAELLDQLAATQLPGVLAVEVPKLPGQLAALSTTKLAALPRPLALRVLQQVIGRPLASVHWQAILQLASSQHGSQRVDLPHGLFAERRYETLYLRRHQPDTAPIIDSAPERAIGCAGEYSIGLGRVRLRVLAPNEHPAVDGKSQVLIRLVAPAFPLGLRRVRPGDRLRLPAGHRKVSDLWTDLKLPKDERAKLWVLTKNDQPLWLLGVRAGLCEDFNPALPQLQLFGEFVAEPLPP